MPFPMFPHIQSSLADRTQETNPRTIRSRCIVGLYVKPTWRPPLSERSVRSVGVYWSFKSLVGQVPVHTWWGTGAPMGPEGRTALAVSRCGLKRSPLYGEVGAGCWAVPFCSVEVWVYIRPSSSVLSSTWPRRRQR